MKAPAIFRVFKEAGEQWVADKATRMGAALAYYSLFSLAPLVVIAVGLAGLVFGERAARGGLARELESAIGRQAADALQEFVKRVHVSGEGGWATAVGLVVLLFGASGVFIELQDDLNTIWKVAPRPGRTLRTILRDRVLSFAIVLGSGFLLLASLVAGTVLAVVSRWLSAASAAGGAAVWQAANQAVSFVLIAVLFGLLYKVLPDVKIAWGDVWVGALTATILVAIGKYLFGLYLERTGTASGFGAAASLVILLLWVYYSAQILLFGAEVVRAFSRYRGSPVIPTDNAQLLE